MSIYDFDKYYMGIAKEVAKNSKCLSRKIGSVLVRKNRIIGTGYNGPPSKVPHCNERVRTLIKTRIIKNINSTANGDINVFAQCPRKLLGYKSGEGLHLCPAVHSEINAVLSACFLGHKTEGSTLYCYCGPPCKDCTKELINAGVVEIVYKKGSDTGNFDEFYDELSKWLVENSHLTVRGIEYE